MEGALGGKRSGKTEINILGLKEDESDKVGWDYTKKILNSRTFHLCLQCKLVLRNHGIF